MRPDSVRGGDGRRDARGLLVLGGGALAELPREALAAAIRSKCMRPAPAETLEIVFSGGEPWLGVLGAALM